jgi:tetratricopeptide (TPR) repeat protein
MSKRKRIKAGERVNHNQGQTINRGMDLRFLRWLLPISIVILTSAVFWPALKNGFVWDDTDLLLRNPYYRGLGWTQITWMFTTFHMGHYMPLSWATFGLDYLLWGMDPFGYHLTNLALHCANAVVFYFIALRLLSLVLSSVAPPAVLPLRAAAWLAALIFAVHPLRVESVAWVTERRDVLSGLFFLLTILCYLKAVTVEETNPARGRWMVSTIIFYSLSLLSKAVGLTLPVVLLMLDVYPLRRLGSSAGGWFGPGTRKVWLEKDNFLLLAIAFGIIALLAQREAGALVPLEWYGVARRLEQMVFGIGFYLWKMVMPVHLSPLYEVPAELKLSNWLLSGAAFLVISISLVIGRHRWPSGLASWVYYLAILAPVLGFAQSGPQIVADRYSYLSCLSWATLSGAGLFYVWQILSGGHDGRRTFFFAAGLAAVVVASLGILTWKQVQVWYDSEALWTQAVRTAPDSSIAHYSLGVILSSRGKLQEAIEHYRRAVQINPVYVDAYNNLGSALVRQGKLEEGIGRYRQALRIAPGYRQAHNNLGIALADSGQLAEAIEHYRQALRIDPDFKQAHYNLGNALVRQGELAEAIEHYRQALRIDPDFKQAHDQLDLLLSKKK